MKGKLYLGTLLVLGFLVVAGCKSDPVDTTKVIGNVNGDNITQAEFDQHYKVLKLYYEQQVTAQSSNPGQVVKLDEVKDKDTIKYLKEQAWNEVVLQKLVNQQAPKEGIKVDEDELKETTKSDNYKKFITDNKLDEDLFTESLKTQYLYNDLKKRVTSGIEISDQNIEKYYNENIGQYQEKAGVEISHILVPTEKQANDILAKLKNGADFAALAKQYSTCSSAPQGGYLGPANEDSGWVDEFQQAAMKLKPGEMTQAPVKTQFGYHIIKAGAQKPGSTRSLKDAHNQIKMTLQTQKEKETFSAYLDDLKKKAKIKDMRAGEPKTQGGK